MITPTIQKSIPVPGTRLNRWKKRLLVVGGSHRPVQRTTATGSGAKGTTLTEPVFSPASLRDDRFSDSGSLEQTSAARQPPPNRRRQNYIALFWWPRRASNLDMHYRDTIPDPQASAGRQRNLALDYIMTTRTHHHAPKYYSWSAPQITVFHSRPRAPRNQDRLFDFEESRHRTG